MITDHDAASLGTTKLTEAVRFLCGEYLGRGVEREVYVCSLMPGHVVKIALGTNYKQNVHELALWEAARGTPVERFLAPCFRLSEHGNWLIQRQTTPLGPGDEKKLGRVPELMTDLKPSNFGWLDGRIVCHDYGISAMTLGRGVRRLGRLVRADWRAGS